MSKLQSTSPGVSGLSAPLWKALYETEKSFSVLRRFVLGFWERGIVPTEWNSGLLAILPEKWDLSEPGNYRGIMNARAYIRSSRSCYTCASLPLQKNSIMNCSAAFGQSVDALAEYTVKMAMKKRSEHGRQTWPYFSI